MYVKLHKVFWGKMWGKEENIWPNCFLFHSSPVVTYFHAFCSWLINNHSGTCFYAIKSKTKKENEINPGLMSCLLNNNKITGASAKTKSWNLIYFHRWTKFAANNVFASIYCVSSSISNLRGIWVSPDGGKGGVAHCSPQKNWQNSAKHLQPLSVNLE